MNKHCPSCGLENLEVATFCEGCGAKFTEKNVVNKMDTTPQYYNQFPLQMPQKSSRTKKSVIAVISIAVVAIIVIASVFIVFKKDTEVKEISELDNLVANIKSKIDGGPTCCPQSLAGGYFQSIPEVGCIAKYYMYNGDEKIGEMIQGNAGVATYNGKSCYKILGEFTADMQYQGISIAFVMDEVYYADKTTKMPVYMSINCEYSKPEQAKGMKLTVSSTWNQEAGQMTTITNALGKSSTATAYLPQDYWGMISSINELYVGYLKQIGYSINVDGTDANVNMKISVTGQEDVVVDGGVFENCYILELTQSTTNGAVNTNNKIWISENGVVPQVITSMGSGISLTAELEGYYTTV